MKKEKQKIGMYMNMTLKFEYLALIMTHEEVSLVVAPSLL